MSPYWFLLLVPQNVPLLVPRFRQIKAAKIQASLGNISYNENLGLSPMIAPLMAGVSSFHFPPKSGVALAVFSPIHNTVFRPANSQSYPMKNVHGPFSFPTSTTLF